MAVQIYALMRAAAKGPLRVMFPMVTDIEDWDSLTHITLISEVESAFGMKFSMKDVLEMKNVGEMVEIIEKNT